MTDQHHPRRVKPRIWWIGVLFMVGSALFALGSALSPAQADARVDRSDWWAAVVQYVGTIFFNVTTFAALNETLNVQEQDVRV